MALIDKLTNIADAIRGKTGGTEPLTLDQMAVEIAEIPVGGSGNSGGVSGIYMAKITPASDVSSLSVTHNLGTTDILCAICWAQTLGDTALTADRITMRTWLKTDIPVRLSNTSTHDNIDVFSSYSVSASQIGTPSQPTSDAYLSEVEDENRFQFYSGGSVGTRFAAGVTYTVIIMAASAFSAEV